MNRLDQFHLRWRGRITGPFTWQEVEHRLDAHEIGLLHDLQHNSQWTTVGDFLAARGETVRVSPNAAVSAPTSAADFNQPEPIRQKQIPQRWIFVTLGLVVGFLGLHDFYAQHWIRGALLLIAAIVLWRLDWGIVWPWLVAIGEIIVTKVDGQQRRMPWRRLPPKS